ncbi:MAG: hypothetical protein KKB34_10395 [Bacteroidetes bacterium]|nr:hypothetical protein [Bacteroidota bacterium]
MSESLQEYTLREFAAIQGISCEGVRKMLQRGKIIEGFQVKQISERKRVIVKVDTKSPEYIHPSKLEPELIVELNNLLAEPNYRKPKGEPNVAKIAAALKLHYTTVYRYIKNQYKPEEEARADKGTSRRLNNKELKIAREAFEAIYERGAQKNAKLAIEKVEMNTGIKIPQRLAYKWAKKLKALHDQKHYHPNFVNNKTAHTIRDLWVEYDNLLDCVVADEWKVDEFGVWHRPSEKDYDAVVVTAYIVMFQDMKTRKPLSVLMTPGSVTTYDTKRAAMELVRQYGRPKQWIFENSKTWKNADFLRFILGLYDDELVTVGNNRIEFMDLDELSFIERVNDKIIRSGVRHPQSKPVERTFRIIKDEFCSYSDSYSPNMKESRKPEMNTAHPGVTRSFEDLRYELTMFLENDFVNRERIMFMDRTLALAHQVNKNRPKTIAEAFDRAYATFEPDMVDSYKLSYLYGDKYKGKFNDGTVEFVYKPNLEKLRFVPLDMVTAYEYMDRQLVVLIDQYDIYHGWMYDLDGTLISEAKDMRKFGTQSRQQANEYGKLKRALIKTNKKQIELTERLAAEKGIKTFQWQKSMADPVEAAEDVIVEDSEELIEFPDFEFENEIITEPAEEEAQDDDINLFDDSSLVEF